MATIKWLNIFRLPLMAIVIGLWAQLAAAKLPGPGNGGATDPTLRIIKTKHYEIHTDLDNALAIDLARRMDLMFEQYVKALKEFSPQPSADLLPAYLFTHKAKYMAFTDYSMVNSGGVFVGGPHSYLAAYLETQGRDQLRKTLQHEAFHQFAYFTISKNIPIWLNEGMAQVFEEGIWTGRDFILGQIPPRRIRQLHADVDQNTLVTFDQFLPITSKQWLDNLRSSAEMGATYYNEAWAIAYFCAAGGNAVYHKKFVDFMKQLHRDPDGDPVQQFKTYFPNNVAFQSAFESWAVHMRATPEATMLERQDVLAEFFQAMSAQDDLPRDMFNFRNEAVTRQFQMQYKIGTVQYSTDPKCGVYFSDMDGHYYGPGQLYLQKDNTSPLPNIVCRPNNSFQLVTHFYKFDNRVEHEVMIVPVN